MFYRFIIVICLFSSFFAQAQGNSSKELLSSAIKSSTQLKKNIPTKQKLDIYENIFGNLNQISEDYSDSDEAIKILSNQNIGSFSPAKLRSDYISLLSSYYDTVCEASPSYKCLGFVALNNGIKECAAARTYTQALDAHHSLLNAISVFTAQEDTSEYADLAMGAYQSCLDESDLIATPWIEDRFKSKLIKPLLKRHKINNAKAIIESMKTPYFKFGSVLELQAASGKTFDLNNINRLDKYIGDKMKQDSWDAFLASVRLRMFSAQHGSNVIDYEFAYNAVQNNRPDTDSIRRCNQPFVDYLYDLMTNYELDLYSVDDSRLKYLRGNQMQSLFFSFADHAQPGLNSCKDDSQRDYKLMTEMYGVLLLKKGKEAAKKFKDMTVKQNVTVPELYDYFTDHMITSKSDLDTGLEKSNSGFYRNILLDKGAHYAVFKKYVDYGNLCNASKFLFQKLKGTPYYNDSIDYIINNNGIDASKKYTCGDEDLELLLQ